MKRVVCSVYSLVDLIPIPQCLWGRTPEQRLFGGKDQKQMVNRREDTRTRMHKVKTPSATPASPGDRGLADRLPRVHPSPCCLHRHSGMLSQGRQRCLPEQPRDSALQSVLSGPWTLSLQRTGTALRETLLPPSARLVWRRAWLQEVTQQAGRTS